MYEDDGRGLFCVVDGLAVEACPRGVGACRRRSYGGWIKGPEDCEGLRDEGFGLFFCDVGRSAGEGGLWVGLREGEEGERGGERGGTLSTGFVVGGGWFW